MKYLLIFILLCSCSHKSEDTAFKKKFFHNIALVERLYEYENKLYQQQSDTDAIKDSQIASIIGFQLDSNFYIGVSKAIAYNEYITEIDMSYNLEGWVYFFSTPNNNSKVKATIKAWKEWYEENKFYMTNQKADSLFYEKSTIPDIVYEIMVREGSYHTGNFDSRYEFLMDSVRNQFRKNYHSQ